MTPDKFAAEFEQLAAVNWLSTILDPYFPVTSSAMNPIALKFIVDEIVVNSRKSYLEFGAGASTVVAAYALKRIGGRGLSVEHDAGWASVMQDELKSRGLGDVMEILLMPLTQNTNGSEWYSEDDFSDASRGRAFDLVVVDGPPAYEAGKELARKPALSAVQPHIAEESWCILLDDTTRGGEKAIVANWEQELRGKVKFRQRSGGFAIARSGDYYNC